MLGILDNRDGGELVSTDAHRRLPHAEVLVAS
jgi:hypothetical protein